MKYKRVLLKLSGEALIGDGDYGIDSKMLSNYANEINEIVYSLYDLDDTEKKIVESNYPLQTKKKQ